MAQALSHSASPKPLQQPHLCRHEEWWHHQAGAGLQGPLQWVIHGQVQHEGCQQMQWWNWQVRQHHFQHYWPNSRILANDPASQGQTLHHLHSQPHGLAVLPCQLSMPDRNSSRWNFIHDCILRWFVSAFGHTQRTFSNLGPSAKAPCSTQNQNQCTKVCFLSKEVAYLWLPPHWRRH